MGWIARLLRHRLFDERDAARTLDAAARERIGARVAASESHHSGEIRVCIEAGLPLSYLRRHASARDRAVALFGKLGVWNTEHNNGVLIYLLLAEHCIEIVADRGINRQVPDAVWQAVTGSMGAAFQRGEFEAGLNQAIDAVDARLTAAFPIEAGAVNVNELPDTPLVL